MPRQRNLWLVLLPGAGALLALLVLFGGPTPAPAPRRHAARTPAPQTPAPQTPATQAPAPAGQQPLRDIDRAVIARVAQGMSAQRIDNALPNQPIRVNLFNDGHSTFAKLDTDHDGRNDEVLEFSNASGGRHVVRHVLWIPASDHEQVYDLQHDRWVPR